MDNLTEIIATLSSEQQKDFTAFIQRNKYRKDRKDLKLFELLKSKQQLTARDIAKKISCPNLNAYHTVRKRLFQHLSDFIVVQSSTSDAGPSSHINTLLSVVRYLFEKGLTTYAWKYLELAESFAHNHDHFEYLHSIYLLQLEKAYLNPQLDFDEIIEKFNENKEHLEQAEKVQIAIASLQNKLNREDINFVSINFSVVLSDTLNQLSINTRILERPRIALTFVETFRKVAFKTKSFLPLQQLLEKTIKSLKPKDERMSDEVFCQLHFYLSHAQFRNRQFEKAKATLALSSEAFKSTSKPFKKKHAAKRKQLKAALFLFTKDLTKAVAELKSMLAQKEHQTQDLINSSINLGIYYFIANDPKSALNQMQNLNRTDNWYEKTMGREWVMKKQLMEVLLYAELNFIDLYESRVRAFKRKYKLFETHPIYYRVFGFLKAIELVVQFPRQDQSSLQENMEKHLVFLEKDEEDLQAMIFYSWLKAKANKADFYPTLLELAGKN